MEEPNKCNLCSKTLSSRETLRTHILSVHEGIHCPPRKRKFKCNICGQQVCTQGQLIDHMRSHTGERPFKCTATDCGMAFKQRYTLKDHTQRKHSDERPFKCSFTGCLHTAKTFADMSIHVKVHNFDRPLYCPNSGCNFRAKHKRYITRHVRRAHSGVEPFACSKCDYKTMRADNIKRHMKHHSNRRDFKCSHPECTEAFKSPGELKLHFSNRHGERTLRCDHPGCGGTFGCDKALNDHKRVCHPKKVHACPHRNCGFRTNKRRDLESHMLCHHGRDKISCLIQGCEYKGKNRDALNTHMHRHRHNILFACPEAGCGRHFTTTRAFQHHVKLHNPSGRPFQCPLCLKHYPTLHGLQNHCTVHTNEKPFVCGHCKYAASTPPIMKTHIASAHPDVRFPFIFRPLGYRECLRCDVIFPAAESLLHSMSHADPVVVIERLELRWL